MVCALPSTVSSMRLVKFSSLAGGLRSLYDVAAPCLKFSVGAGQRILHLVGSPVQAFRRLH